MQNKDCPIHGNVYLSFDKDTYNVKFGIDNDTFKSILKDIKTSNKLINNDIFEYTYKLFDQALKRVYPNVKPDTNPLYEKFRRNIIRFAAYKSAWVVHKIREVLDGKNKSKITTEQINNEYNNNYMRTEFIYTVRSARIAQRWQEFEANKHIYPYLEYLPSTAAEPRLEHKKFYGVIKHIDDPFWDTWLPPNGWGCKCSVRPVRSNTGSKQLPDKMPPEPPEFMKQNPAKKQVIFNNEASYFKNVKEEFSREKARELKYEYELLKETIPYELAYQSKGKVYTHIFKEESEKYTENLETAKLLADNFDIDIKIRPIINVYKYKNPDFLINDIYADQVIYKEGTKFKKFIHNAFKDKFSKSKNGQLSETGGYLILRFPQKIVINKDYIKNKINNFYRHKCFRVFIINGNEITVL